MNPDRLRRQQEAKQRQAERDVRDPVAQLRLLDDRPGESARERARITPNKLRRKATRK